MTVYVDKLVDYGFTDWRKGEWAHMWSDTLEQLHEMADKIGLDRKHFQNRNRFPHYDLRPNMYLKALERGARKHDLGVWIKETEHDRVSVVDNNSSTSGNMCSIGNDIRRTEET